MGSKASKEKKKEPKDDKASETLEEQVSADFTKNDKWVKAMEEYFETVDMNKNGYITIEEILRWSKNLQEMRDVVPTHAENLERNLRAFYGAAGLLPGKQLTKEEFIEGVSRLGQAELDRKTSGEETLHENLLNAFYEAMDINHDGTITLDEVKTMVKACNMNEALAERWFNAADKNKNGVVEPSELTKAGFSFWFKPEDFPHD